MARQDNNISTLYVIGILNTAVLVIILLWFFAAKGFTISEFVDRPRVDDIDSRLTDLELRVDKIEDMLQGIVLSASTDIDASNIVDYTSLVEGESSLELGFVRSAKENEEGDLEIEVDKIAWLTESKGTCRDPNKTVDDPRIPECDAKGHLIVNNEVNYETLVLTRRPHIVVHTRGATTTSGIEWGQILSEEELTEFVESSEMQKLFHIKQRDGEVIELVEQVVR